MEKIEEVTCIKFENRSQNHHQELFLINFFKSYSMRLILKRPWKHWLSHRVCAKRTLRFISKPLAANRLVFPGPNLLNKASGFFSWLGKFYMVKYCEWYSVISQRMSAVLFFQFAVSFSSLIRVFSSLLWDFFSSQSDCNFLNKGRKIGFELRLC